VRGSTKKVEERDWLPSADPPAMTTALMDGMKDAPCPECGPNDSEEEEEC